MSLEAFEPMCYGPIGEAVLRAEPHTEADPVGVYASILALWSSAINGYVTLDNGRPVIVWTVLAGESAIGRKGTALRVATAMAAKAIGPFLEARTAGGVSSGPSLTQLLYERQDETEGTESGIDTRTVIVDEEWSENLKRQNRCPTFASKLRSCWDGVTIRHTTTKVSMTVHEPRLGFHAHITPGEWSEYVKPRDAKGGSFNRLLPVMVQGSKVLPYGHKELYPEIAGLADAYDWARRTPRRMTLSKDAARRFDDLRAQFLDKMVEMPEYLRCYVERTPEQILRVAAVLTASEMRTTISRPVINAAWAFVQYSMRSVEKLVRGDDTAAGNRKVKSLPDLIREKLTQEGGEADRTRLLRLLGSRATATSLLATGKAMEDVEIITGETESGLGRKPLIFRLTTVEAPAEETTEPEQEEQPAAETEPPAAIAPDTPKPLTLSLEIPEQRATHTLDDPETQELMLSAGWL